MIWIVSHCLAAPPGTYVPRDSPDAEPEERAVGREATGFGMGIILGLPTGLSFALRSESALWYDAAFAWSFGRTGGYAVHFDFLFDVTELRNEDEIPDVAFPIYLGVGPRMRIGGVSGTGTTDPFSIGARVPIGMGVRHDGVPVEGFVELVPGLSFYPATSFYFEAAIGGRYYFGKKKAP